MHKLIFTILIFTQFAFCQTKNKLNIQTDAAVKKVNQINQIIPGKFKFNTQYLKNFKQEMTCYAINEGRKTEISTFLIETKVTDKDFAVYTTLTLSNDYNKKWIDTSIVDKSSLLPKYHSTNSPEKNTVFNYTSTITGSYQNKINKSIQKVNLPINSTFFDNHFYPYILGTLPLSENYKASFKVFDFKPNENHFYDVEILNTYHTIYNSPITGDHKVFAVRVIEKATNDIYEYFIDKESRRLWALNISIKNQFYTITDNEVDAYPFKNVLNKENALQMITEGNSSIKGVAFAKDNQAPIKGIAVVNINKKQFAAPGTMIVLIPLTPYFKEWLETNEKLRKKGRSVPMSKDASECLKVAYVQDEGNFEFTDLKPGEYLLYTEFEYAHQSSYTEVVGYTDTYINGAFQGTTENTVSHDYVSSASAFVKETVTIKKENETTTVKLKKTR